VLKESFLSSHAGTHACSLWLLCSEDQLSGFINDSGHLHGRFMFRMERDKTAKSYTGTSVELVSRVLELATVQTSSQGVLDV
jgi:hypothetical protein